MTSVVIVGSGFTGFECARSLARRLRKNAGDGAADVDISIISPVDYMLYTPLLPDVAGGLVDARFVAIPLANSLRGVQIVRGRAEEVDFSARTITFTDPEERSRILPWDRLVLTPGSVTRLFDVPGLAEHARGLKSTAEALYLRDHVIQQLELADVDDDPGRAEARRTIVVVGASYSGTELAAQLRALADSAAKQIGFDPAAVKFVLLDLAEQVMPEVGEKLGEAAMKVLRSRGIDVRLGVTLKEVHAEHVVLSDDSLIRTHTVAWVTGVTGAPLIEKLGLPTEKGRLKVTTELQVPGHPDVFAAGDAAAVPDVTQPGKITPPTAQHATRQGKLLGRNVAASLGYGKPKKYKHRNMGLVVDLGPKYAVANPLNVRLSGFPAKTVARIYHLYAIPRGVNRWAVALAYLTDMLFDRSVVSIGLSTQEDAQFSASEGIPLPKAH
ncbi:NAD(P)/FAD-dependent oxidoreductase [Mycolicibacterium elephantis]|uniref:NAD(P)/FAD-dependent oxidoreductase n=1 Tax=Mycolicibacterium elephantis TaxID=81858 RepID=UPI000629AE28|nr:NAD(P)/FAD-dependent oxidoreductase [Mycolicibacterium elephantis]KKW62925.1 NADH dehydrogenase [Mycolicibacterium elephantis]OBA72807.1 NADH dehydrogenase [Mycolicibacterium elephantis]OBB19198.1 NADH dehydrogenase [Mycolicibacterium elephantis]OBE92805.1 NADH dehydrogenase [Mycolicibacterium elephantis]